MDKFLRLKEEREKLKQERREVETVLQKYDNDIVNKNREMAQYYADFFMKKSHQDFKLYTKFPSVEALQMYVNQKDAFPLKEEGTFNAKELAEMIKQFYSYQKQQEYQIFTIGINEEDSYKEHGFTFCNLVPHLYYLIGNPKTLEPFLEYNGQFINKEKSFSTYYNIEYARKNNLVSIPLKPTWPKMQFSDIECLTGSIMNDEKAAINYYDYYKKEYDCCFFDKNVEIFTNNLRHRAFKTSLYGYNGVKDLLSFYIHRNDTFIARILISICIYKHNNRITELTSEDYHHIFKVLYGEEVDIVGEAEKDITRSLKYVPSNAEINLE